MKKAVPIILALAAVLMLAFIIVLAMKYREQGAMYAESRQSEEAVRTQFNAALESIAEIQDSLSAIAPDENRLNRLSQEAEMGSRTTQTQKERMLSTIADLQASIKNTRQRIRELESSLKGSQAEVAGLRRVIDNLKRSIGDKEAMIARLTARVDSLRVTVVVLQGDVRRGEEKIAEQVQVIEEKRREITTIHYVIGTKKELKTKGLITERGGLLGLGKSAQISGTFNESDFMSIDTDQVSDISIPGKEAQVLSAQSKSSYQLLLGEGRTTLHILDAREFRRVKYLVIMVK
jgi:peptidoglycan hydrolase CwlO-like protein